MISTKGFRKQRGKFHLIMHQDIPTEMEAFKNLLTSPFKVCIPGSHFVLLRVVMFLSAFVIV